MPPNFLSLSGLVFVLSIKDEVNPESLSDSVRNEFSGGDNGVPNSLLSFY